MIQDRPFHKALIYFIPLISILWSIYLLHIAGPFYLSRIDPEFVYLLNGLNSANLDFYRIGHIDHPGTPFQILTGIFIWITFLVAGQGNMVEDVIARPELYLTFSTILLAVIMATVLLWFGKIIYKNNGSLLELLILQSAVFIGNVLIDLPARYIPDRFLEILVLVFSGLCYQYFYAKDYTGKKFAIYSGIVMGIGFITKFNFLPLLLVPFMVVNGKKNKMIYIGTFMLTAFIMFLPVIKEFAYFRGFITSIITHDGLYGGGSEQVFNAQAFWHNSLLIFKDNLAFTIVVILSIIGLSFLIFKPDKRKSNKHEFLFYIANVLAILIAVVMVSKHYKSYYLIPVVSLTAFVFLVSFKLSQEFVKLLAVRYVFGLMLLILIIIPTSKVGLMYQSKINQQNNNQLISNFIQNNISSTDYLFIEPTWLYGPMLENGLTYGISYVAFRHYYYNEFERIYNNVITWEGEDQQMRYFRLLDADNETILKSGKRIFVVSTPGRNAEVLCSYLDSCYNQYNINYSKDTVFFNSNTNEYIISFRDKDGWKAKMNSNFGFEKVEGEWLFSDDGMYRMGGSFERDSKRPANASYTLKIPPKQLSPEFIFEDVDDGDFIEITIKRKRNKVEQIGNLHLYYSIPDSSNTEIAYGKYISHISEHYELLRLTAEVTELPANAILKCAYYNHGDNEEFVDDLKLLHFSKN